MRLEEPAFNKSLSGSRLNIIKCFKSAASSTYGFEIVLNRDRDTGDFGLRASVQSIILSTIIEKVQRQVDMRRWNHIAINVDP